MPFVLTAEIRLRPPTNARNIVQALNRQLQGVQTTVNVTIPRNVTSNLKRINKEFNNTTKAVNATSAGLRGFGESAALAFKRFSGFVAATVPFLGFVAAVKEGVQAGIDFEREMVRIAQVTGRTVDGLRDLSKEIGRVSTSLGVSSADLLQVSRILSQTGLSADDVRVSLQALAKTSVSPTFGDIVRTTEGAVAIFRQFKLRADELEGALSSINAVAGKFAVESEDIITAVRRTGGAFEAAGGNLNELIALLTSVRSTTRESAESISTGFRTIFTRLQRTRTINFLETLGVQLRDFEGQFVGPFEAIKRLSTALNQLSPRDPRFAQITEELGGFRQVSKVIPLIKQFATAQRALAVAQQGQNSLAKDAEIAQQSLAVQFQKTKEEFLLLIREFTASDAFKNVARFALQMANAFIKVADSLRPLIPIIGALSVPLIVSGGAKLLSGFKSKFTPTQANRGGLIRQYNTGGVVPGSGNRDTEPAMLTPGEFVIRKNAVKSIGVNNLQRLNKGGRVRMAEGGDVPANILDAFDVLRDNSKKATQKREARDEILRSVKVSNKRDLEAIAAASVALRQRGISDDQKQKARNILLKRGVFSSGQGLGFLSAIGLQVNTKGKIVSDLTTGEPFSSTPDGVFLKRIERLQRQPSVNFTSGLNTKVFKSIDIGTDTNPIFGGVFFQGGKNFVKNTSFQARGGKKTFDKLIGNIASVKGIPESSFSNVGQIGLPIDVQVLDKNSQKTFARNFVPRFERAISSTVRELGAGIGFTGRTSRPGSITKDRAILGQVFEEVVRNFSIAAEEEGGATFDFPTGIGKNPLFPNARPGIIRDSKLTASDDNILKDKGVGTGGKSIKEKVRAVLNRAGSNVSINSIADDIVLANSGGRIPGKTDTVPALLTPGEFVVKKSVVDRVGVGTLNKLNNADKIQGFQDGGLVRLNSSNTRLSQISPDGTTGVKERAEFPGRRVTARKFREKYGDDFVNRITFRSAVSSHRLTGPNSKELKEEIIDPLFSDLNKRITKFSPNFKFKNSEEDNARRTIEGIISEAFIGDRAGLLRTDDKDPFDFKFTDKDSLKRLNRIIEPDIKPAKRFFIDAKRTKVAESEIVRRAIIEGLFDRQVARLAKSQDVSKFNRGGLVENTYYKLNQDEQSVIDEYAGNGFSSINGFLRTGEGSPEVARKANTLVNATKKKEIGALRVFRGISQKGVEAIGQQIGVNLLSKEALGKVYEETSVVSTSLSRGVAKGFREQGGALLRISTRPDGTGVRVPFGASLLSALGDDEREVLLPPSKFKVGKKGFRQLDVQQLVDGGLVQDITPEELDAIKKYVGSSTEINKLFLRQIKGKRKNFETRTPTGNSNIRTVTNDLIRAINKGRLSKGILYRGVGSRQLDDIDSQIGVFSNSPEAIGKTYRTTGVYSTSKDQAVASEFGSNIIVINTKAGGKGLDISRIANAPEAEVLLPHGQKFQILDSNFTGLEVQQLNSGGRVRGAGNRDTVPALLTPGEFVLRKDAVNAVGSDNLQRLNRGGIVGFQDGGEVKQGRFAQLTNPAVLGSILALGSGLVSQFENLGTETKKLVDLFRNFIVGAGATAILFQQLGKGKRQKEIEKQQEALAESTKKLEESQSSLKSAGGTPQEIALRERTAAFNRSRVGAVERRRELSNSINQIQGRIQDDRNDIQNRQERIQRLDATVSAAQQNPGKFNNLIAQEARQDAQAERQAIADSQARIAQRTRTINSLSQQREEVFNNDIGISQREINEGRRRTQAELQTATSQRVQNRLALRETNITPERRTELIQERQRIETRRNTALTNLNRLDRIEASGVTGNIAENEENKRKLEAIETQKKVIESNQKDVKEKEKAVKAAQRSAKAFSVFTFALGAGIAALNTYASFLEDEANKSIRQGDAEGARENLLSAGKAKAAGTGLALFIGGAAAGGPVGALLGAIAGVAAAVFTLSSSIKKANEEFSRLKFAPVLDSFNNRIKLIDKNLVTFSSQLPALSSEIEKISNRRIFAGETEIGDLNNAITSAVPQIEKGLNELALSSSSIQEFKQRLGEVGTETPRIIRFLSTETNTSVSLLNKQFEDLVKQGKLQRDSIAVSIEANDLLANRTRKAALAISSFEDSLLSVSARGNVVSEFGSFASGSSGNLALTDFSPALERVDSVSNLEQFNKIVDSSSTLLSKDFADLGEEIKFSAKVAKDLPQIFRNIVGQSSFARELDFRGSLNKELERIFGNTGIAADTNKIIISQVLKLIGSEGKEEAILKAFVEDFTGTLGQITEPLNKAAEFFKKALSESNKQLTEFSKNLDTVAKNNIRASELENRGLDLQDQLDEFRRGLTNANPDVQTLQNRDLQRLSNITGGALSPADIFKQLTDAQKETVSLTERLNSLGKDDLQQKGDLIQKQAEQREIIDRSAKGLEFLADSTNRLRTLQNELKRVTEEREKKFDKISDFVFGDRNSRVQQIQTLRGVSAVSRGLSPNALPDELRGQVRSFLREFRDVALPVFGGKTGRQVEQEAIQEELIRQGFSIEKASEIALQSTTTEQDRLIAQIEEGFNTAFKANDLLVKGIRDNNDIFLKGLREQFAQIINDFKKGVLEGQIAGLESLKEQQTQTESENLGITDLLTRLSSLRGGEIKTRQDLLIVQKRLNQLRLFEEQTKQEGEFKQLEKQLTSTDFFKGLDIQKALLSEDFEGVPEEVKRRISLVFNKFDIPELSQRFNELFTAKELGFKPDFLSEVLQVGNLSPTLVPQFVKTQSISVEKNLDKILERTLVSFGKTIEERRASTEKELKSAGVPRVDTSSFTDKDINSLNKLLQGDFEKRLEDSRNASQQRQTTNDRLQELKAEVKKLQTEPVNNSVSVPVSKNAGGGFIPGFSQVDNVPALLTRGEFVMSAPAVRNLGVPFLSSLNTGFSKGGAVGLRGGGDAFEEFQKRIEKRVKDSANPFFLGPGRTSAFDNTTVGNNVGVARPEDRITAEDIAKAQTSASGRPAIPKPSSFGRQRIKRTPNVLRRNRNQKQQQQQQRRQQRQQQQQIIIDFFKNFSEEKLASQNNLPNESLPSSITNAHELFKKQFPPKRSLSRSNLKQLKGLNSNNIKEASSTLLKQFIAGRGTPKFIPGTTQRQEIDKNLLKLAFNELNSRSGGRLTKISTPVSEVDNSLQENLTRRELFEKRKAEKIQQSRKRNLTRRLLQDAELREAVAVHVASNNKINELEQQDGTIEQRRAINIVRANARNFISSKGISLLERDGLEEIIRSGVISNIPSKSAKLTQKPQNPQKPKGQINVGVSSRIAERVRANKVKAQEIRERLRGTSISQPKRKESIRKGTTPSGRTREDVEREKRIAFDTIRQKAEDARADREKLAPKNVSTPPPQTGFDASKLTLQQLFAENNRIARENQASIIARQESQTQTEATLQSKILRADNRRQQEITAAQINKITDEVDRRLESVFKVRKFQTGGSVGGTTPGRSQGFPGLTIAAESIQSLETTFSTFSAATENLAKSIELLNGLSVQHQIGGTVEVILNGAEVLNQLGEPLQEMINQKVADGINKMLSDKFPNSGSFRG